MAKCIFFLKQWVAWHIKGCTLEQVVIEGGLPKATFDHMDHTGAHRPPLPSPLLDRLPPALPTPGCPAIVPVLCPCHHRHRLAATTTAHLYPPSPQPDSHRSRPRMPPPDRHRSHPHPLPNSARPPMPPLGRPQPPPPDQLQPPPSLVIAMPQPSRGYHCHRPPSVVAPPPSSHHRQPSTATHCPIHTAHCLGRLGRHPATAPATRPLP